MLLLWVFFVFFALIKDHGSLIIFFNLLEGHYRALQNRGGIPLLHMQTEILKWYTYKSTKANAPLPFFLWRKQFGGCWRGYPGVTYLVKTQEFRFEKKQTVLKGTKQTKFYQTFLLWMYFTIPIAHFQIGKYGSFSARKNTYNWAELTNLDPV